MSPGTRGRRRLVSYALRLLVPALIAAWIVFFAETEALLEALSEVDPLAFVPAELIGILILTIGGLRWRVLMRAFGATSLPSPSFVVRAYFVGHFYNTFVPGAVGGDVARGLITRQSFRSGLSSYTVVVTERLIGLCGLGVVCVAGIAFFDVGFELPDLWPWAAFAFAMGLVVVAVAMASQWTQRIKPSLPAVARPSDLVAAFVMSLVTHGLSVSMVWLIVTGFGESFSLAHLAVIVPLSLLASALPLAFLGLGPREVALSGLLTMAGIPAERALAISLVFAVALLGLALLGGAAQILSGRLDVKSDDARTEGSEKPS